MNERIDYIPPCIAMACYAALMFILHYGQLGDDNVMNFLVRFYFQ